MQTQKMDETLLESALQQALKEGEDSGRADYSLQGLIAELDQADIYQLNT